MTPSTERPALATGIDAAADGATPGVAPSGGGYRAIITSRHRVIWSCSHVHFTEHSAKACAERHLARTGPPFFLGH
jgi:hypothetical protein